MVAVAPHSAANESCRRLGVVGHSERSGAGTRRVTRGKSSEQADAREPKHVTSLAYSTHSTLKDVVNGKIALLGR